MQHKGQGLTAPEVQHSQSPTINRPSNYQSGFCSTGHHGHCIGDFRTAVCNCTCHTAPAEPPPADPALFTCPVRHHTSAHGEMQCTEPLGHEKAHAIYIDGRLLATWLTPEEAAAARARGEYDHPDYCRCADPVPVCDDCGGEIL